MGKIIQTQPNEIQSIQTVELADRQARIRSTWNERTISWYIDIEELDGTQIYAGLRMSPGWSPTVWAGGSIMMGGELLVRGFDGYARGDLGESLKAVFYADNELPQPVTDDGITVEIVP